MEKATSERPVCSLVKDIHLFAVFTFCPALLTMFYQSLLQLRSFCTVLSRWRPLCQYMSVYLCCYIALSIVLLCCVCVCVVCVCVCVCVLCVCVCVRDKGIEWYIKSK